MLTLNTEPDSMPTPMWKPAFLLLLLLVVVVSRSAAQQRQAYRPGEVVLNVTMHLSAFGVESDTYPSIAATLDLVHHTSQCERSYFDPAYPSSTYHLSAEALDSVQLLVQQTDWSRLKTNYSLAHQFDLPTSVIVIRMAHRSFTIKDYGLEGASPLPKLYRLVYKFEY